MHGHVRPDRHQRPSHGAGAQALLAGADENERVAVFTIGAAQQVKCGIRQRHTVLLAAFHAFGRNHPKAVGEIDFAPAGTEHFVGSGRGQDQKFQRLHRDASMPLQRSEQCRHLAIRHRGVMFFRCHLRRFRQHVLQHVPSGRVLTGRAMAARRRIGQRQFDWFRTRLAVTVRTCQNLPPGLPRAADTCCSSTRRMLGRSTLATSSEPRIG